MTVKQRLKEVYQILIGQVSIGALMERHRNTVHKWDAEVNHLVEMISRYQSEKAEYLQKIEDLEQEVFELGSYNSFLVGNMLKGCEIV